MSRPLSEPSFPKDVGRIRTRQQELERRPSGASADSLEAAVWQDYDPFLLAPTTNPTGWVAVGKYIVLGKTCLVQFEIETGASFNEGVGDLYYVSLPVEGVSDGLPIGCGMTIKAPGE